MTLEEFERDYAWRSCMTVEKLHDLGMRGQSCDCGETGCKGWQMKSQPQVVVMPEADASPFIDGPDGANGIVLPEPAKNPWGNKVIESYTVRSPIPEWQQHSENEWVFGVKIRGIVRKPLGEVYFDEDRDEQDGGWVWFINQADGPWGVAHKLTFAVEAVEKALGVE